MTAPRPLHQHLEVLLSPGTQTPSRSLSLTPKAFLPRDGNLSKVFVGIALKRENESSESVIVVSDGRSVIRSERSSHSLELSDIDILDEILDKLELYADTRAHKIEIVALSSPLPRACLDRFIDRTWLSLDALAFLAFQASATPTFSLEGQAVFAIEEAVSCLEALESSTVRIQFDGQRRVLPDANHRVQLGSISLLQRISSPTLFSTFQLLSRALVERKIKVGFFSATPRGGGVALMRHAMMRLWHQVGVDASWYVPPGDSNVFNVTKRKFHNILQGVAPTDALLTDQDKALFVRWAEWYVSTLWQDEDGGQGSQFLGSFDVIVIDDPQVLGLVPYIRKFSSHTKIIYRSHIQIRGDLVDSGMAQQKATWDFLWEYIRQVDVFVAHPLEEFVPQIVKDSLPVVYMPPCTAPLDGLNKPIPSKFSKSYRQQFNLSAQAALGRQVDWQRGYILQIARFDPSKGIPDLVEAYRLFRVAFSQNPLLSAQVAPQLVLTGHSSIDDPDAVGVLKALYEQLSNPLFDAIRNDIFAIRAPSSDRLLNTILHGADVVCQVSIREGYEIKVSEAIDQGQWVIGTRAGGIPLQIRDGVDGRLVPPRNPLGISEALLDFYLARTTRPPRIRDSDQKIRDLLAADHTEMPLARGYELERERHSTLANATMWQFVFLRLVPSLATMPPDPEIAKFGFGEGIGNLSGTTVWDVLCDTMST